MPTPPRLTNEQRRAAYEKALELRRQRAELKRWLAGEGAGPEWRVNRLADAFTEDRAQGMKVYDLLVSLPGIGRTKALKLLSEAGFKHPEKTTVRATGPRQRERLFELLTQKSPR